MTDEDREDPWDAMDRLDAERGYPHYFDRKGMPMSMREWVLAFEVGDGINDRVVAFTQLDGVHVSTVWLGLDHSFGLGGPPMIFETMVFVELDQPVEVMGRLFNREGTEMFRWPTEEAALNGHNEIVASLRVPSSPTEVERNE